MVSHRSLLVTLSVAGIEWESCKGPWLSNSPREQIKQAYLNEWWFSLHRFDPQQCYQERHYRQSAKASRDESLYSFKFNMALNNNRRTPRSTKEHISFKDRERIFFETRLHVQELVSHRGQGVSMLLIVLISVPGTLTRTKKTKKHMKFCGLLVRGG